MQISYPGVTPVVGIAVSGSPITIPVGARGWSISVLAGTVVMTTNGVSITLPVGFNDNDLNVPTKTLIITPDVGGQCYVRYNPAAIS